MLKKLGGCAALYLLTVSTLASAADLGPPPLASDMTRAGFFIGLGGGFNSVKFDQQLFAAGVSNVFSGSILIAFGQAGGPANPFSDTKSPMDRAFGNDRALGSLRPGGRSR